MHEIHKRKRRLPKPITVAEDLPKRELRRRELQAYYKVIPLSCIYVDPKNGVELFKNKESGSWCYRAETVLHQYTKGE